MKEEMLKSYLEAMRFLASTTDEMMYLCDLASKKIYFADNYAEKLQLSQIDGTEYTLEEMQSFLYARNGEKVHFKLSSFENLKDNLLYQEYHLLDKYGKKYKVHSTERLQFDGEGNPVCIIGQISDIASSQKVDALTGLFNSKKLMEDLTEALEKKKSGFLVILGIDNFKNINNKYGRSFGNHVLKKMAETLDSALALSLRAYRLDSDKFAIHAVNSSKEEVEELYRNVQEKIQDQCTLSSGAAEYKSDDQVDANAIYQHAENALDDAKRNGKNKLEFFSESMYRELLSMIDFKEELKRSVENGFDGFSIRYQPQMDIRTCTIYGIEALLRYNSRSRGQVSPDEFIPVLEQTELILSLGGWVLSNALSMCKKWRSVLPELRVSVNLSFVQMRDGAIWEQVPKMLDERNLPGNVLTLELTESIHMQDYQSFNKIFYKLGKRGVRIAIDDFGTGYSSLSYLKSIAIDEIKIDRSFVSGIQYSAYNYRLLGNLIELAHSANIHVCCEGVETEAELQIIKELHPDRIQGYLFGKPLSIDEFEGRFVREDTEEYQKARGNEEKYRLLKERENSEVQKFAKQEKMAAIVDGMDEMVYVCDNDTYELMYLNASGRELTGMYDYNGRKCYEVMYGRKSPCEFCQKEHVGSESYHVWEWDNEYLHRHFLVKDKLIQWTGKVGHLTVCIDITEKEIMSKEVQEKLEFEQNIVACTKMLVEERDRGKAINGMLALIGQYYDAKRAYLCNVTENAKEWENTYEWCAKGVVSELNSKRDVPVESGNGWKRLFMRMESLVIENVESVRDIAPDGYRLLKYQGINSLIVSPIRKNLEVVGFIIVDDPKKHRGDFAQLETMAYFLVDRLIKDDTKDRLTELLSRQHMRQTEMYKAILSETIAYAEIDLESKKLLDCGGLWKDYKGKSVNEAYRYKEDLISYKEDFIYEDDIEAYRQFFDFDLDETLTDENRTQNLQYRRNIGGVMQWVELTAHIFSERYTENRYALIYLKNIDAEKQKKLQQEEAASKDHLTGVYNRMTFEAELKKHVQKSDYGKASTLIMLDLDNFKMINDQYGHMEGDLVLKQMADVLKSVFRQYDLVGRLGGDEFLVFLKDLTDKTIIDRRIRQFRDAFSRVNAHNSTCSMGITIVERKNFSYEDSLRRADVALYQSKENGKNIYSYYEDIK